MKTRKRIFMMIMSSLLFLHPVLGVSAAEADIKPEAEQEEGEAPEEEPGENKEDENSEEKPEENEEDENSEEEEESGKNEEGTEEESDEDAELEAFLNEAEEALKKITDQDVIMALVYLCDTYKVRETPGGEGEVCVQVPTGTTVQIIGVALDEEWNIYYLTQLSYNDKVYTGYIDRSYLAYSNELFLEWENTYFPKIAMYASISDDYPDVEQFPASYKDKLRRLKQAHPNWIFVKQDTRLNWQTVVENENYKDRNLIASSSGDAYKNGKYSSSWSYASKEAVEYYLDPRNFLDETRLFQFEQLTYNSSYHSKAAVDKILSTTFMKGELPEAGMSYASAFYQIGVSLRVSPFHLACRVYQEQGKGNSALISGTYSGYEGYYNYYNIGASGSSDAAVVKSGLERAKKEGWNTPYASLKGGAVILSKDYILKGQDTLYLQKFDVDPSYSGLYWHQYMQNIMAPYTESQMVKRAYTETGSLDNPFVFKIPVYQNMPATACPVPGTGSTSEPTATPTLKPTEKPTATPTLKPTEKPTATPTLKPTEKPTATPTLKPTEKPEATPTLKPTEKPAASPTLKPTAKPTEKPTAKPTEKPITKPTEKPTARPTEKPITKPTERPTARPTEKPIEKPTAKPTEKPIEKPTAKPTEKPIEKPTEKPTAKPTETPLAKATEEPAEAPTAKPTEKPTAKPTEKPTAKPTEKPTVKPAQAPEAKATEKPAQVPEPKATEKPAQAPEPKVTEKPMEVTVEPQNAENSQPQEHTGAEAEVTVTATTPQPQTAPKDKSVITMEMDQNSKVYAQTLEQIRKQGKKVVLEMGEGVSWSIDGNTMGDGELSDIDFKVTLGSSSIPEEKRDALTNGESYIELSLAHDGALGFGAVLSVVLEDAQPGQYANLFYYDEQTGDFAFMCASPIGSNQVAAFEFIHASDYIIIISDETKEDLLEARALEMEEAERMIQEELNSPADEKPTEEPVKAAGIIALILLGSVALVIGAFLIFRRRDE